MWKIHLIYSATVIVRVYVPDGGMVWVVSDYFPITSYLTLFPYEGLLKHCICFIASSFALLFQPPQAVSCA